MEPPLIDLVALKYDHQFHFRWKSEVRFRNRDTVVALAAPGTVCTHYGKNIEFEIEHYSLNYFDRTALYNTMMDFDRDGRLIEVYCNIALVHQWGDDRVTWIDLDLDVVWRPNEGAQLVDEDEFEANARTYDYPPDLIHAARSAGERLLRRAEDQEPPFQLATFDQALAVVAEPQP